MRNVFEVTGTVRQSRTGTALGVNLALSRTASVGGLSAADCTFNVSGAEPGNYTLTATKTDNFRGITAFVAALALRHAVGKSPLTAPALTAADVDKSGIADAWDADLLLQSAARLRTPDLRWNQTEPTCR